MKDWIRVTAGNGQKIDLRASAIVKVYDNFAEPAHELTCIVSGGAPAPLIVREGRETVMGMIEDAQHG